MEIRKIAPLAALTAMAASVALSQTPQAPSEKKATETPAHQMGFYAPTDVQWKDGPVAGGC